MDLDTIWHRLESWWHDDDDQPPNVDLDYLKSPAFEYQWMTVHDEAELIRCNICGRLMDLDKTPAMVEHVGTHNEHGAAEVDPTEVPNRTAEFDYSDIATTNQEEAWEI